MNYTLRNFALFFATLSLLLGLTVLFGWYTHNLSLIQISSVFAPMQFNTALGFLLSGIGLLLLLIDQKQTEKNFLLESILKIKKDTETKTIESHLTRIRNKLFKINSKLKILSKDDKVFLTS